MAVSKDYGFKKGDKIRIVDVSAITLGRAEWNNGDITEFVDNYRGNANRPRFKSKKRAGQAQYISLDERHAIELVPAFKVGDVVEVVANTAKHHFPIGEHVRITAVGKGGCDAEYLSGTDYWGVHFSDVRKIEAKEPKLLTESERITELGRQVAELTERMAKMERNEEAKPEPVPALMPNQERKAIIAEARKFVKDTIDGAKDKDKDIEVPDSQMPRLSWCCSEIRFEINAEKRTVVALAIGHYDGSVVEKTIAKCSDGDVFNAEIGKAIAVAKLFGLDFERFANAVQPIEIAVGQRVATNSDSTIYKVREFAPDVTHRKLGTAFRVEETFGWLGEKQVTITDDSDAQYAD